MGKPVHGQAGGPNGMESAKHVTDGDPSTHAKPPASNFEYRIDLQDGANVSYAIEQIAINWGCYGDRFIGVRKQGEEKWASGAWPGEYVTSYKVEYRKVEQDNWEAVHQFSGRPVDENAAGVDVIKLPAKNAGCSSESFTILKDLDLHGVAELRISAIGGHWIGLFELEAMGHRE
jgi:hypothetical protein